MLLNFSTHLPFDKSRETRFVQKIQAGVKLHTLRRGFRWKAGDRADIYTGARTKAATKHAEKPVLGVADVVILFDDVDVMDDPKKPLFVTDKDSMVIYWNGWDISSHLEQVARNDGFDSLDDFQKWFWLETNTSKGDGAFLGQCLHFKQAPGFMLNYASPYMNGVHINAVKIVVEGAKALYHGSKVEKEKFNSADYQIEIRETILKLRSKARESDLTIA